MNEKLFYDHYKTYDKTTKDIQSSINTIKDFEAYIGNDIESSTIQDIKAYVDHLIECHQNKYDRVIHIARYYHYVNMHDHYIHMTKYFNSLGVLENIIHRISLYESKDLQELMMGELELPPFGTSPEDMPRYTHRFMKKMLSKLDLEQCKKILAGNNHQIPEQRFQKEKDYYEKAPSLDVYLKERHQRKVKELQEYYDHNRIWFEQIMTPEVIEFVKGNQEILSGVLKDNKIYVTKIPYDISRYLKSLDEKMKQYYACHCSFVRENILTEKEDIPREWCYCSGGFAKRPFEVIFGQKLQVELMNTAIDVSNVNYKKG